LDPISLTYQELHLLTPVSAPVAATSKAMTTMGTATMETVPVVETMAIVKTVPAMETVPAVEI